MECKMNEYQLLYFLTSFVYACSIQPSQHDAPPIFTLPAKMDDPKNLILLGNVTQLHNTIICSVKNADVVVWRYSQLLQGPFNQSIPSAILMEPTEQDAKTNELVRVVSDRNVADKRQKTNMNGYYKCVATNRFGYMVETPPIRLIIPGVQGKYSNLPDIKLQKGLLSEPFRLPCVDLDQMELIPADLLNYDLASFQWAIYAPNRINDGERLVSIEYGDRMKIDPRTGDLFFTYLIDGDRTGDGDTDPQYQCVMSIGDSPELHSVSRHRLSVNTNSVKPPIRLMYPVSPADRTVTCLEQETCSLTCIFGGGSGVSNTSPVPIWYTPAGLLLTNKSNSITAKVKGNTVYFTAYEETAGTWTCKTNHSEEGSGRINVIVKLYPKLYVGDMKDRIVEVGKNVDFSCSAKMPKTKLTYYVNGQTYNSGRDSVKFMNVQRNDSAMIACIATNDAGVMFNSAQLNVFSKPNITISPEGGHYISKNYTEENLLFHCQAVLDPKVIEATVHWMSNHTKLKGEKLTGKHNIGIRTITYKFDRKNRTVYSTLKFDYLDSTVQKSIIGGVWWCVINMKFYGNDTRLSYESLKIPFDVAKKGSSTTVVTAGFQDWWLIGVIVAVFFIILIFILIACCVRQHQGENYYVDENERKAGHNPEEEMGLYGFSDYKRPATGGYTPIFTSDQDPIKGSHASLDRSERPLDSDSEGMDEYGDIDPGRFNEDGSFIGQYGKSSTHIDV